MGTERLGSVLLSILLLTSLITPLLVSITITSVGTVEAATDHVVISEVFYDETSTDINEFVELYNPTDHDIDIGGWRLKNYNQTGSLYTTTTIDGDVSGTTVIKSHGFYLVGEKNPLNSPDWGGTSITPDDVRDHTTDWQNGPGDYMVLEKGDGTYVDGVRWGAKDSGDDIPDDPNYADVSPSDSIERKSGPTHDEAQGNGYDTDDASNDFRTRDTPEPQNSSSPSEPSIGVLVSISPSENSGLPETSLTYTVVTKNTSEVPDNYTLTVTDNENWGPTLDDNQFLNVGPGENGTTTLRVTIPVDAEDGAEDLITVTATSLGNENISDNGSCKAICYLLPLPQHYKEYPTDDQAVMEGMGNLSENYENTLPCGRYHLGDCPKERSFLKFDISSIPPGATIENAYLGVYHHFGVYTEGRWCWVEVWTVENDNWTETEIDWSNQPPKVENLYHEYINYISYSPNPWLGTIYGWPGVPVKSYIQNEIADGVASFVLYSPQEDLDPSENTDVDFTATDDNKYPTQWPYLEIWYYENLPQVLFSVSVSPGSQAGWPGENLEYIVTVKNRGTINDNYDLVVSDNAIPSWNPMLSDYLLVNVPPGENRTVTLSVTIPENAELDTVNRITVTATSQADNRISESAEAIATGSGFWIVASYSPYIESYAVGVTGAGENIYIANSSPDRFMGYNSVSDTWYNLSVPSGLLWQPGKPGSTIGAFKNGTCMAWDNGDYLYTLFGASYADGTSGYYRHYFYRYSISNGNWEQLENTLNPKGQGAGDAITWVPGSVLGTGNDWIYAIVGSADHGTSFWRYNINTDTWGSMSFNPGWTTTDDGCSLVWTGDNYLYALRGEWQESSPCYDFARYDLLNDNWEDMASIPAYPWGGGSGGVGDGGSMLWIGGGYSDYIYALSGNQCVPEPLYDNRFYLYTISTNTWQRLADMPGGVGSQNGPRLGFATGSMGKIYCWRGCNGDPVLWAYLPTEVGPPSEVEVRLDPIDDSGVSEGYPDNNYGAVYNMYNGWSPEYLSQRNYLKFDVSSIPSGSVIKSATLRATGRFGPSGATLDDFTWHLVDAMTVENDDWSESTITWNNAPPLESVLDTDNFASYAFVGYWNWLSWDVTDFVASEFLGDQLVSIGLKRQDPENAYISSGWFATKDSISWTVGYEPCLDITYTLVESYAVQVSIDPGYQSGSPGDTLNYTVMVTNIGVENDNFDLEVSDSENWGLLLSDNLLEILAGENENVTLFVTIPGDAEYCTEDLITVTATSKTDNTVKDSASCIAHQDYFEKECMPDLGQHSENWCWVAAAANSIKWYAHHGYPELLDDPSDNVLDDNYLDNYIDPIWFDNYLRLLHEIAIDGLYPGVPENEISPDNTFCKPISNDNYFYGLQEFIDEQGAPLRVHEIVDNDYFNNVGIPPEDGENVIYAPPTFENYKKELERCQDVLLQLAFRNYSNEVYEKEALDHIVTGVSFFDGGENNQWIQVSDPWTKFPVPYPGPDHNNLENRYTYENLQVLSNDPFIVLYTGENLGGPIQVPVQVVKLIYISPTVVEIVENYDLVAGWNLISFPVASEDDTPDNIFAGQTYYIWKWDAENKKYVSPSPTAPVEIGVGYWVYADHDKTVTTSGIPVENYSIDLITGWNLVGFPVTSADTTPDNIFAGQTYYIWKWDAENKKYVSPSSTAPVELGVGYWVYVDHDKTITVPL